MRASRTYPRHLIPALLMVAAFLLADIGPASAAQLAAPTYGSSGYVYDEPSDVAPMRAESRSAAARNQRPSATRGVLLVSRPVGHRYDDGADLVAPRPGAIVDAGKYDYLFGNVSSNSHNLRRSLQNQRQLNRIGVYDNAAGRDLLSSHFDEVLATDSNIVRTWTDEWGTHQIRESIFAGPNGVLKFESSWQVTSDGFRLETVIPFGGG